MAFLIPIALAIGAGAVAVATAIAAVVMSIVTAVCVAFAAIASAVAIAATYIVSGVISSMLWITSEAIAGVMYVYNIVAPIAVNVYQYIATLSKAVYAGVQWFLEAIHFELLLKIHNLGMIFSPAYREMMQKVYDEISKLSSELGLGANFISLALEDARNVVLDVSSIMGRSYDLGQVQWLGEMNGFLEYFQYRAADFAEKPGELLEQMHDFFDRPAIDAKKAHQQALWTFIEGVVTVADGTVDDLVKFRQDIDQTILHLPHTISDPIYAKINPKLKSFDRFIENEYRPVAEDLSNAIHVLTDTTERQTDTLGGITNSILNPGDLLGNIDNLSDLEKIRQEGKIAEIANRAPVRASESVNESIAESHKGIKEIFDASIKIREKPPYHIPEIKQLVYEISITPPLHLTWFVGDF